MVNRIILIAGGSGNLGSHINFYFKDNFEVFSTYYKNKKFTKKKNYIYLNLNNKNKVIKLRKKNKLYYSYFGVNRRTIL